MKRGVVSGSNKSRNGHPSRRIEDMGRNRLPRGRSGDETGFKRETAPVKRERGRKKRVCVEEYSGAGRIFCVPGVGGDAKAAWLSLQRMYLMPNNRTADLAPDSQVRTPKVNFTRLRLSP